MVLKERQKRIYTKIDQNDLMRHWKDWNWQLKHSIRSIETFEKLLGIQLDEKLRSDINKTTEKFPISITPYYLSLIDTIDLENDPVYKQSFPSPQELETTNCEMADPLHEDKDSPVPGITHRYPDRVLFLVSNMCSMYCRHCTRKRKVGDVDYIPDKKTIQKGIDYI